MTASCIAAVIRRKRDPRGLLRIGCGYCKGQDLTAYWRTFNDGRVELDLDGYSEQDGTWKRLRPVRQRRNRTGRLDDLAAPLKPQWGGFRTVELPIKIECPNCEWVNKLTPTTFGVG